LENTWARKSVAPYPTMKFIREIAEALEGVGGVVRVDV
jgi:hypothetical protein